MALEYKKFDMDNESQKGVFEDLLSKLEPNDIIEIRFFERVGFGRPHNVEVHMVFNGDYSKDG